MMRRKWRWACVGGLVLAAVFSAGCDDMIRRSVRDGMFTYISGGISSAFDRTGPMTGLLNDLVTGGLFGITGGSAINNPASVGT